MGGKLKTRIEKLEKQRSPQSQNRIVFYNPELPNGIDLALQNTKIRGKIMLIPEFTSEADWERASIKQQSELVKLARSRK